jgi:lipoprotein-releasing system ATP-binding protein
VLFDGVNVNKYKEKALSAFRNKHIGFVFQFHQLLPEFTAVENVLIPAYIAGKSRKEARNEALEILKFMGLEDRATHKPNELSGGEKQRVAVARALINHPNIILADEPSGSLDSRNKEELHQLFFDLRKQFGQTFVIVTHDEKLAEITDRTLHIVDGLMVRPAAPVVDEVSAETVSEDVPDSAPEVPSDAAEVSQAAPDADDNQSNVI